MIRFSESAVRLVRSSLVIAGLLAAAALSACSDAEPSTALAPTEPAHTMVGAPVIAVGPSSLDFYSQVIGVASPAQELTVSNGGSADLVLTAIFTAGTNADDFLAYYQLGGSCYTNTTVAPGGSCTYNIAFKPTASGTRNGIIQSYYNGGVAETPVTGVGVLPGALSVSTPSLAFGSVAVGSTSASQAVTITNTGSGPLTLSSAMTSGPAAGDFPPIPTTGDCVIDRQIAPGDQCTLTFAFSPYADGARSTTLAIESDGGTASVVLEGTGVMPQADVSLGMTASPTPAQVGKPLTYTITLKNLSQGSAGAVTMRDALPSSVSFASISTSTNASCTTPAVGSSGIVSCALGTLAPGATTTIRLVVNVVSARKAQISNTATATTATIDPVGTNDSATVVTAVNGRK
jgi:uncharacterized repeat protein (TIGR01451 family)